MTELVSSSNAQPSLEETLGLITRAARDTVPGIYYASISIRTPDGQFETLAPTDSESLVSDQMQYEVCEGPCVDAASGESVVHTNGLGSDARWPRYGPRAQSELGIQSQLAFEMFSAHHSHGGLNLYSRDAGTFDEDSIALAQMFAMQGAMAMGQAHTVKTLNEGMSTRQGIGQAVGLIMERYQIDEGQAFGFLVRLSQQHNVKLREIAVGIVSSANEKAQGPTK